LLTHTVGLGYDIADPDIVKWSKAVGRTATCNDWSLEGFTTPTKFPPGEGWCYGTATDWACQALEKLTGQRLSEYVQVHIFDPLGMKDSTWWPEKLPHVANRTAQMMYRQEDGTLQAGPPPFPVKHPIESGGSGMFTTPRDYATFMQGFLAGKLLKKETMDLMFTSQLDGPQEEMLNEVATEFHDGFKPEFPRELRIGHGIGGIISKEGCTGKRSKGSMSWSGYANSRWVGTASCRLVKDAWKVFYTDTAC
jgi:CubicO group peptidase (beta-lactamase class C family)